MRPVPNTTTEPAFTFYAHLKQKLFNFTTISNFTYPLSITDHFEHEVFLNFVAEFDTGHISVILHIAWMDHKGTNLKED